MTQTRSLLVLASAALVLVTLTIWNNASGAAARVAGPLAGGALITAGLYDGAFVLAALVTVPAIFLSIFVGRAMMLHRAGVASRSGLP